MENDKKEYEKNAPIFTDTEPETSIELEKSIDLAHDVRKSNATGSVFNLTLSEAKHQRKSESFTSYENRIRKEVKHWNILLRYTLNCLRKCKEKRTVDCNILSSDKRDFLNQEPELQRFMRNLKNFRLYAFQFIEKDYKEMKVLKDNIVDACKQKINLAKSFALQDIEGNENL